ncbi:MAG: glycosyl hydrolase family 18 protein, partial [Firmicutes bacterium]|nr:glycosyl hydrolase family 18 protein [Bacillota bacterium]
MIKKYFTIRKIIVILAILLAIAFACHFFLIHHSQLDKRDLDGQHYDNNTKSSLTMDDTNNVVVGLDSSYMYQTDALAPLWKIGSEDKKFAGTLTVKVAKANDWAEATSYQSGRTYLSGDLAVYNDHLWKAKYWINSSPGGDAWEDLGGQPTPEATFNFTGGTAEIDEYLAQEKARRLSKRKVFGYMPSWGIYSGHDMFDVRTIKYENYTHITYSFLKLINVDSDNPTITWDEYDAAFQNGAAPLVPTIKADIAKYPDKHFVFSVGGWTYSENQEFERATSTPAKIDKFAQNIVDWMMNFGFTGIDIDWEFPKTPQYAQQFLNLHKTIREKLTKISYQTGEYYELSTATTPNFFLIEHIMPQELGKYVDTVNFMAYDYNGGWIQESTGYMGTGHNAPLYQPDIDPRNKPEDKFWIDVVTQNYLKLGVKANQLMFGVAFYSRGWKNVKKDTSPDPVNFPGLGAKAESIDDPNGQQQYSKWGNGSNPYYEMEKLIGKNGFQRYWDDSAKVPYLYSEQNGYFHSYDDKESLEIKIKYLRDLGLAGAIVWDITGDTRDSGTGSTPSGGNFLGNIVGKIVGEKLDANNSNDVSITTNNLADAEVNKEYSTMSGTTKISASGKDIQFSFDNNSQTKDWLSIDKTTGQLSGKPNDNNASQAYKFTIKATSSNGSTDTHEYTIKVISIDTNVDTKITTTDLPNATVGVPYQAMLQATGKDVKWGISSSDNLQQNWIFINHDTGELTGTPTTDNGGQPWSLLFVAKGSNGSQDSKQIYLNISKGGETSNPDDAIISTNNLADAEVNTEYSTMSGTTRISASGKDIQFSFDNNSQTKDWLSIDKTTGQLSGKPTDNDTSQAYKFSIKASASNGSTDTHEYTIKIATNPNDAIITTNNLAYAETNTEYSTMSGTTKISASGKDIQFSFDNNSQTKDWLSIDKATGQLSGKPTDSDASQAYKFTIKATSSNGSTDTREYTIKIIKVSNPDDAIITTNNLAYAETNTEYSTMSGTTKISASGKDIQFSFDNNSQTKDWLSIDKTSGQLSGKPETSYDNLEYKFSIKASASNGSTDIREYTIKVISVDAKITTTDLPSATVGVPYQAILQAIGKDVKWGISSIDNLQQNWIFINHETGELTGTPTTDNGGQPWSLSFIAKASNGTQDSKQIYLNISKGEEITDPDDVIITTNNLADAETSTEYSTMSGTTKISASGKDIQFSFDNNSQTKDWLSIDKTTGQLSGKPTDSDTSQAYKFSIKASASNGSTDTHEYTIKVISADTKITTTDLPNATVGVPYQAMLQATGKDVKWGIS